MGTKAERPDLERPKTKVQTRRHLERVFRKEGAVRKVKAESKKSKHGVISNEFFARRDLLERLKTKG